MNKILLRNENRAPSVVPARSGWIRDWQRRAPYAAIVWSLIYAALGVYWALTCGLGISGEVGKASFN